EPVPPAPVTVPARAPIGPLRELLPWLRGRGCPVVWLNWGNRPDRANLPPGVVRADGRQRGGVPGRDRPFRP
ncbi:MAG: hypothetical protein J2P26_09280, partial [Nocardiopsaceae bacterium]|nr:hypothetical protein [Nocardiopsaceae bacterium]